MGCMLTDLLKLFIFRLPGFCKHIFAALFKIEFLSSSGQTRPSCTDLPCAWNQPSTSSAKDPVVPKLVSDVEWRSSKADKEPGRRLNPGAKRDYVSYSRDMGEDEKRRYLGLLGQDRPSSAAVVLDNRIHVDGSIRPLTYFFEEWRSKSGLTLEEKQHGCLEAIMEYFTPERIEKVQESTAGQWRNGGGNWEMQRRWRLTASLCHQINNAVVKWRNEFEGNAEKRKATLEELWPPSRRNQLFGVRIMNAALDYGRKNEENALNAYLTHHKANGCPDAKLISSGLILSEQYPFLGASPDGIIECKTHGKRLVEAKCPKTCENGSVYDAPYMDKYRTCMRKNNHCDQVLMQMALAKVQTCDLIIWCPKDFHIEECVFSPTDWDRMEENLVWFFKNVVLEKALTE